MSTQAQNELLLCVNPRTFISASCSAS